MGHILHDWDLEQKRMLLQKAHAALPTGGALIVYESIIDDERRENAHGLLMSLNMLIETAGGFDFTGADCQTWMREAGFKRMSRGSPVRTQWLWRSNRLYEPPSGPGRRRPKSSSGQLHRRACHEPLHSKLGECQLPEPAPVVSFPVTVATWWKRLNVKCTGSDMTGGAHRRVPGRADASAGNQNHPAEVFVAIAVLCGNIDGIGAVVVMLVAVVMLAAGREPFLCGCWPCRGHIKERATKRLEYPAKVISPRLLRPMIR
jgi:O-methyltransferase